MGITTTEDYTSMTTNSIDVYVRLNVMHSKIKGTMECAWDVMQNILQDCTQYVKYCEVP